MRCLLGLLAALFFFLFAGSAQAATSTTGRALGFDLTVATPVVGDGHHSFAAAPVADEELAAATGQGLSRGVVRTVSAAYAQGEFQRAGAGVGIALDNWFHDIGNPLIADNLTRAGGFT